MYYTHNLRVKVQEWLNRLYRSSYDHFNSDLPFFLKNIEDSKVINGFLQQAIDKYPNVIDEVKNAMNQDEVDWQASRHTFVSEEHKCAFYYMLLKSLLSGGAEPHGIIRFWATCGGQFDEKMENYVSNYIKPIVVYLEDALDEGSSVLYILEKYKFRTENFLRTQLVKTYRALTSNYEQMLEDDLRLYLFDQGIEYPFSTPKSSSGRADIVGQLDSIDPLVLEIKVVDADKRYGKERILSGFKQIVKYSQDYSKNIGYLVTFIFDDMQIEIENTNSERQWPMRVEFSNSHYYLVFISMFDKSTASKGKLNKLTISQNELVGAVDDN